MIKQDDGMHCQINNYLEMPFDNLHLKCQYAISFSYQAKSWNSHFQGGYNIRS